MTMTSVSMPVVARARQHVEAERSGIRMSRRATSKSLPRSARPSASAPVPTRDDAMAALGAARARGPSGSTPRRRRRGCVPTGGSVVSAVACDLAHGRRHAEAGAAGRAGARRRWCRRARCTMRWQTARPRPVPRALVVKKGVKSCCWSASGTPGPLSSTVDGRGTAARSAAGAGRGSRVSMRVETVSVAARRRAPRARSSPG